MEHQTAGKIDRNENAAQKVDVIQQSATQPHTAISHLHRAAGNRAVGRLFQAKFVVGEPGDQYEQEADRVAEQVMRMPGLVKTGTAGKDSDIRRNYFSPPPEQQIPRQEMEEEEEMLQAKATASVQRQDMEEEEEMLQAKPGGTLKRQEEEEEEEEEEFKQAKGISSNSGYSVQRQSLEEEEETMQTKSLSRQEAGENGTNPEPAEGKRAVAPEVESQIVSRQGSGQSMPEKDRAFFESGFGQDFSRVQVHTGPAAASLSSELNARAFTVGSDVFFGEGQYRPESEEGQRLIAHELTHVVQQRADSGTQEAKQTHQKTIQKQGNEPETESAEQSGGESSTGPSLTVPGPFGDVVVDNYSVLLSMSRLYASILEDNLDEVDETASVYRRAREWIDGAHAWQSVLEERGDEPLSPAAVAQAQLWVNDYTQILEDIRTYKQNRTIRSLRSAQAALNRAASQMNTRQPEIDEALRSAFLSGDTDAMAQVTSFIGNVLDIGLDLSSLSRQIGSAITEVHGGTIPEASRYTGWLENINRTLAAANLIYSLANVEAPTELGTALNGVNTVADAFSAGGTLLGLASHIGLYANLYLVPLTQVITARLGYIIDRHLHELNIVSAAIGWDVNMSNEPGGWPVFYFMYDVMHAGSAADIPESIPGPVEGYFLSQREMIEAGAENEMPTTGWWFWRGLDESNIRGWIFNNRQRLWAMFYGRMRVPRRRPRRR